MINRYHNPKIIQRFSGRGRKKTFTKNDINIVKNIVEEQTEHISTSQSIRMEFNKYTVNAAAKNVCQGTFYNYVTRRKHANGSYKKCKNKWLGITNREDIVEYRKKYTHKTIYFMSLGYLLYI